MRTACRDSSMLLMQQTLILGKDMVQIFPLANERSLFLKTNL
jgi:hypothetical protein